jgi:hypothetical protein
LLNLLDYLHNILVHKRVIFAHPLWLVLDRFPPDHGGFELLQQRSVDIVAEILDRVIASS